MCAGRACKSGGRTFTRGREGAFGVALRLLVRTEDGPYAFVRSRARSDASDRATRRPSPGRIRRGMYQLGTLFSTPFPALAGVLASDRLRSARGCIQGNGFVQSERRTRPVPVSADRLMEPGARDGGFSACGRI